MIFRDNRCEEKNKDDDDKEELVVLGQKGKWGLALPVSVGRAASSTALLFFGMPPCNKKEKNHLKNVQNYMLYVMRKEIQKATHTFLAALLFFGMPRNKKGKNVQDYIKHENRKLWGKSHLSSEYNQPLCPALLWNTEQKNEKCPKLHAAIWGMKLPSQPSSPWLPCSPLEYCAKKWKSTEKAKHLKHSLH